MPEGLVLKWDYTGDAPRLFYRTCTAAGEWGWGERQRDAHRFEECNADDGTEHSDARKHAAALKVKGERHVFEVMASLDERQRGEQHRRRRDRAAAVDGLTAELRRAPADAYRETCRRLGEHEAEDAES